MFKLWLHRAGLRAAAEKLPRLATPGAAPRLPGTASRCLGTHGRNEPREPLNSPQRAKEFIYRLQPKERTCLLGELQSFESRAIAQETLEPSPPTAAQIRYETLDPSPPTAAQIRYVLFHNALPFVGFGFLDNAIMIAAGTQIELSIGVTLGISTMAGKKTERDPIKSKSTSSSRRHSFLSESETKDGEMFKLDQRLTVSSSVLQGTQIELSIGVTLGISTMAAAALGNLVSDLAGLGLAGYVEALASKLGMQVPDLTPKQVDMWQTRLSSHMGKGIGVSIGCILGMFPLFFLGDDDEKEKEAEPSADTSDSS
uniref:Transmembrane protein 65 n=1 Tax=Larimichthys crocea TaxID=215358 RepID=A0A0F8BXI3_LARCR